MPQNDPRPMAPENMRGSLRRLHKSVNVLYSRLEGQAKRIAELESHLDSLILRQKALPAEPRSPLGNSRPTPTGDFHV